MKQIILILIFIPIAIGTSFSSLNAQVGINTDNSSPDASAMLDIKSIDKGMLVPRLTSTQRTGISSPATGLLVFDSTTGSFWYYGGAAWTELSTGSPKTIADADNDTKIQVEESADEDKIRFDVAGTEVMVIDNGNVGIGETTPTSRLVIRSDANNQTANELVLKNREVTATGTASRLVFQGYRDSNDNHEVASIEADHQPGDIGNTVHGADLVFKTNTGDAPYNEQGFERMRITEDGNVGIGTSTPSNPLSIRSNTSNLLKLDYNNYHAFLGLSLTGNPNGFFINARGDVGEFGNIQFQTNDVTRMSIEDDGKVEIGSGNIALTGSWLSNDGDDEGIKIMDNGRIAIGDLNFISGDGDAEGIRIGNNGNVGIGNATGNAHFFVEGHNGNTYSFAVNANNNSALDFAILNNGDIYADLHNNTQAFPVNVVRDNNNKLRAATSSRRYKKNIRPANLAADVEKFLSLEPKAFQFKEDPRGIYDYGFIAEEVDSLGLTNPLAHWEDGKVQSIYFDHIAFYNFAALQQHRDRITVLEKSIAKKDKENELLQSKLADVEQLKQQFVELKSMIQQSNLMSASQTDSDE